MWTCTQCGMENEDALSKCANCGMQKMQIGGSVAAAPPVNAAAANAAPTYTPMSSTRPPVVPMATIPPPPVGAPIAEDLGTFGHIFGGAWTAYIQQVGTGILGFFLLALIAVVGMVICLIINPIVGLLFAFIVIPVFIGGGARLWMKIVNQQNAEIGDIFSGFSEFGKWLGLYWLMFLLGLVASLPNLIITGSTLLASFNMILFHGGPGGMHGFPATPAAGLSGLAVICNLLSMVLQGMVAARWGLSYFAAVETESAIDALRKSAEVTEGKRWFVFAVMLLAGIIGVLGVLGCGIGVLFTIPLTYCILAMMYSDFRTLQG